MSSSMRTALALVAVCALLAGPAAASRDAPGLGASMIRRLSQVGEGILESGQAPPSRYPGDLNRAFTMFSPWASTDPNHYAPAPGRLVNERGTAVRESEAEANQRLNYAIQNAGNMPGMIANQARMSAYAMNGLGGWAGWNGVGTFGSPIWFGGRRRV